METDKGQSQDILQIPSFTFFISIVLKDFSTMKNTGLHKIFFNREKNYENQETFFLKLQGIFFVVICLQHSQYATRILIRIRTTLYGLNQGMKLQEKKLI